MWHFKPCEGSIKWNEQPKKHLKSHLTTKKPDFVSFICFHQSPLLFSNFLSNSHKVSTKKRPFKYLSLKMKSRIYINFQKGYKISNATKNTSSNPKITAKSCREEAIQGRRLCNVDNSSWISQRYQDGIWYFWWRLEWYRGSTIIERSLHKFRFRRAEQVRVSDFGRTRLRSIRWYRLCRIFEIGYSQDFRQRQSRINRQGFRFIRLEQSSKQ